MAELHRECCECGMPLSVPTKRPCRCDSCCVSDRYEKQMGAKDAEIAQLRADLARATAELDETRNLLIAQAEGCISFAWTDDVDGRNYRSDVPYFAAQVAVPLRDFFRALREWTVTNAIRIRLAEVERALNEAIEDRRQARDDAARAAALLAVRTMERDARPAISREDAARVASWMDAAIFDGIDESTDPPAWAYNARDALRAHAAKGGPNA